MRKIYTTKKGFYDIFSNVITTNISNDTIFEQSKIKTIT